MNEKIFINIASYRDPSLIITIKSALLHAKNPENLVFAIGAQYYDSEMPDFNFIESQAKVIKYNPDKAPGVGKVRYEISQLFTDEKYFLMIDSHVLFKPGWDVSAKESLKKAETISGHSRVCTTGIQYTSENNVSLFSFSFTINKKKKILNEEISLLENDAGCSEFILCGEHKEQSVFVLEKSIIRDGLLPNYYIRCGNFFTYSEYLLDVGQDAHSDFLHEEAYLSWKTYISGWDVYCTVNNFMVQDSSAYFNIVWNDDSELRTYQREETGSSLKEEIDMFSAMIFNKSKKYYAKNQRRPLESYWELMDEVESYEKMKNSTDFLAAIHSFRLWEKL
jgi:hypothetical protein